MAEVKNRGKKRARTKGLQKQLLQQIEFYFGDANLQKDRFLQQKMKEHPDGYISVETIASFNKMKSLTTDIKMIVQVMKSSNLLELSDDEEWVRRSTPLPNTTDTDSRTIYVEHLPLTSDQDSVRKLLKVFGNITYVSLPRHKVSGAIKGFAFVEFSTSDEVTATLKYFKSGTKPVKSVPGKDGLMNEMGGRGGGGGEGDVQGGDGRESGDGGLGEKDNEGDVEGGNVGSEGGVEGSVQCHNVESTVCRETSLEETRDMKHQDRKRKREDIIEADDYMLAKKPRSNNSLSQCKGEEIAASTTVVPSSTTVVPSSATVAPTPTTRVPSKEVIEERPEEDSVSQSRKRRREDDVMNERENSGRGKEVTGSGNKSAKPDLSNSNNTNPIDDSQGGDGGDGGDSRAAQRLDSQTTEDSGMDEVKGQVEHQKKRKRKNRQHKKIDWETALKSLQLRVMAKKEWLEMRGIFYNLQKQKVKDMKQQLKEEESTHRERGDKGYVGKCLVKVERVGVGEGEDLVTLEKLKEICSKYGTVAYVDLEEGASDGYIRYAKSGCVENLVNAESLTHVKFTSVSDEDERAYYLKTVATRKQLIRSGQRNKKRNIRGQDKIISRALQHQSQSGSSSKSQVPVATHIRFSESEHES